MAKWIKVGMTWDQFTDADVNGKESIEFAIAEAEQAR